MASSCRQPQAPVILNRANSPDVRRAQGPLYPRGSEILGRDKIALIANIALPTTQVRHLEI